LFSDLRTEPREYDETPVSMGSPQNVTGLLTTCYKPDGSKVRFSKVKYNVTYPDML